MRRSPSTCRWQRSRPSSGADGISGLPAAATRPSRRPPSVVIADNDPTVLELLRVDLALEGYEVVATAEGGEAALAACAEHRPDVLIVDYRMPPGPDGLDTIAMVHAANTAGALVLYTNYQSSGLACDARRYGAVLVAKGPLRLLREALARLTDLDGEPQAAG